MSVSNKRKLKSVCYTFFWMLASLALVTLSDLSAHAKMKPRHQKAQQKSRVTNINFNDQLVKGGAQTPDLFYLLEQKQFNYGRLIKLRQNFLPEMQSTSEDMKR